MSEAGIRVIAPDQRGYGATDRPEPVEDYDMEHLTGDLVGLLDHLKIDKAIFVGHDWGGFIVWQMPLRHLDRVAGVVGVNTPHWDRAPADPIELFRQRFGDKMYIVQFQDLAASPTGFWKPRRADLRCVHAQAGGAPRRYAGGTADCRRRRVAAAQSGVSADDRELRCQTRSAHADPVGGGKKVFVDTFTKTGFTGGINWYRNFSRNWQRSKASTIPSACRR